MKSLCGYEGLAAAIFAQAVHDVATCDTKSFDYKTAVWFLTKSPFGATISDFLGLNTEWIVCKTNQLIKAREINNRKAVKVRFKI